MHVLATPNFQYSVLIFDPQVNGPLRQLRAEDLRHRTPCVCGDVWRVAGMGHGTTPRRQCGESKFVEAARGAHGSGGF